MNSGVTIGKICALPGSVEVRQGHRHIAFPTPEPVVTCLDDIYCKGEARCGLVDILDHRYGYTCVFPRSRIRREDRSGASVSIMRMGNTWGSREVSQCQKCKVVCGGNVAVYAPKGMQRAEGGIRSPTSSRIRTYRRSSQRLPGEHKIK